MPKIENKSYVEVEVKAIDATEEWPHGSFEAWLSTDDLDRDGEIVDFKAFDPLPEYWPAIVDHVAKAENVVGWGVPSYVDGKLKFVGGFDPDDFSQIIRGKLVTGSIRKMSVGFMNAVRVMGKDGVPHVTKAEGLEGSFVVIPSNRSADVVSAKAYADVTPPAGSFEETQEAVRKALQSAHDDQAWVCPIATFDDHVVYKVVHWPNVLTDGVFSIDYKMGDDGATLEGDPTAVEIAQVITAKALESWNSKAAQLENEAKAAAAVDNPLVDEDQLTIDEAIAEALAIEAELADLDIDDLLDDDGEDHGVTDQSTDDIRELDATLAAIAGLDGSEDHDSGGSGDGDLDGDDEWVDFDRDIAELTVADDTSTSDDDAQSVQDASLAS